MEKIGEFQMISILEDLQSAHSTLDYYYKKIHQEREAIKRLNKIRAKYPYIGRSADEHYLVIPNIGHNFIATDITFNNFEDENDNLDFYCQYKFRDDELNEDIILEPFLHIFKIKSVHKQPEFVIYDYTACRFPKMKDKQIVMCEEEIFRVLNIYKKSFLSKESYNYEKFATYKNFI